MGHQTGLIFLTLAIIASAHAWGPIGHQTVAQIAQMHLTPQVAATVNQILDGLALRDVAIWADQVRDLPQWAWSFPLHFADTMDQKCDFVFDRDCHYEGEKGMCVVNAIKNYTSQLQANHKSNIHFNASGHSVAAAGSDVALKFVTHFVGDIHQPLHCGFLSDEGGNLVVIEFFNQTNRLHGIWDYNMIERVIEQSYNNATQEWVQHLVTMIQTRWADDVAVWTKCNDPTSLDCVAAIASESAGYACTNAYLCHPENTLPCPSQGVHNGTHLDDSYYSLNIPVVERRIAMGGMRLAAFLNKVLA
eukprot:m.12143 g.12143  ORF g.12143 m.12143 type:complete len:304 (-) comp5806_c0_seq1:1745-2656(-)